MRDTNKKSIEVLIVEVGKKKGLEGLSAYGYAWDEKKNMVQWVYRFDEDELKIHKGLMDISVLTAIREKLDDEKDLIEAGEYGFSEARLKECAKLIADLSYLGWRIRRQVP